MLVMFGIMAALAGLLVTRGAAFACTTVLVGKDASETGEVLVAHNEDSNGRYVMRTHLVPEARRTKETTARFEPDAAELSLPSERPKLFWSEARQYVRDGRFSSCDFYVNGYGVVICSDNCSPSREDRPDLTGGGVGYGIRRVTAERAKSAYNAVEVAAELMDRYGYIDSGRSYHFADKDEIWVMQVVNGKHYAIKRMPDDHVYVNPNHYTIRCSDPGAPGAEKLVSYAAERGWYDPALGPFDFARAYQAPDGYRAESNFHRHLRGLEIILGHPLDPNAELPFSVRPARKIGVSDCKKVLRCHFEGTSADVSRGDSPHFMETRPVCAGVTLESTIVQIRENHDMTLIRRASGRPCLAPYTPWYFGMLSVPAKWGKGGPDEALDTHFAVPSEEMNHKAEEAWWRYTDVQTAVDILYKEKAGAVKKELAEFEEALEDELRRFEPLVIEHFKRGPDKARGLLTGSVSDWAARALSKMEKLFSDLGVLELGLPERSGANCKNPLSVRVPLRALEEHPSGDLRGEFDASWIALGQTLLGLGYAAPDKWSKAVSAEVRDEQLCLSFGRGEWMEKLVPCEADIWLVLENKNGRRLAGRGFSKLTD